MIGGLWWLIGAAASILMTAATFVRRRQPRRRLRRLLWQIVPTPAHAAPSRVAVVATAQAALTGGRLAPLCAMTALGAAIAGLMLSGPVAASMAAVYGAAAVYALAHRSTRRADLMAGRQAMEAVGAMAADLRAGLNIGAALTAASPMLTAPTPTGKVRAAVAARVSAALDLAMSTGAPLADVLDRLDHHLRAVDRAHATARAQAAGAQASAMLLAAMPIGGVAVGFVVGTNPLAVLFHTALGAGCLAAGIALQLAGLAWSQRLARVEVPV